MIILSIDSSTPVASIAIVDEQRVLGEYTVNGHNTHTEKLMVMIAQLLEELSLTMQDLTAIAVAQGPGSFTGLRIGMATAKGLAQGSGKGLIAIPSLTGLAYNLLGYEGLICPILNAQKNEVYTALYAGYAQSMVLLAETQALKPEVLAESLKKRAEKIWFLGDGVPVYQSRLMEMLGEQALFAPPHHLLPRAASVGLLAVKRAESGLYDDLYGTVPIYIRKSEAEVQWEGKHGMTIDQVL